MKLLITLFAVSFFGISGSVYAGDGCATIQGGTILDSKGNVVETGFDKYGYNYQAHSFNGFYDNFSRPDIPVTEGTKLQMKWSDEWLSNRDCDGDNGLDRGAGTDLPGISQGWLTNHVTETYEGLSGEECVLDEFIKIVYKPVGCSFDNVIWGSYCVIEEVSSDSCGESIGRIKDSLVNPAGLGLYLD